MTQVYMKLHVEIIEMKIKHSLIALSRYTAVQSYVLPQMNRARRNIG